MIDGQERVRGGRWGSGEAGKSRSRSGLGSAVAKACGSAKSSSVGSRSGWPQSASRPATPRCSVSAAHSAVASRSRRGRSSRPTSAAKVCSAGPPAARRRRKVSRERGPRRAAACALARVDHVADPALDQGERGLQPGQRGLLRGRVVGAEDALDAELAHRLGVGRVDAADRLLDRLPVDRDAARVRLDRRRARARAATARARRGAGGPPRAAPRRGVPGPRRSPGPRRTRAMLAGTSAAVPAGPSGSPMSPAESTSSASEPSALPSWPPKRAPPDAWSSIAAIGPSWARTSLGHQVAHGVGHLRRDRVAQLPPDVEGVGDPVGAAPGLERSGCRRAATTPASSHRSARRSDLDHGVALGARDRGVVAKLLTGRPGGPGPS